MLILISESVVWSKRLEHNRGQKYLGQSSRRLLSKIPEGFISKKDSTENSEGWTLKVTRENSLGPRQVVGTWATIEFALHKMKQPNLETCTHLTRKLACPAG